MAETHLTRRHWLRSSALALGGAGLLATPVQAAIAASSSADQDPGVFNVLAFGAKGDGIADDTAAIQAAIDAAQNYSHGNVSKGGVVYLPTGVYAISKTLLVTQAIKIFGQGQATIDGATHIVPASLDFDVFKLVGVSWGIVLEGFLIKAYNYHGTGGHFLRIEACQHVRVRGVHLVNCWNGALVDSSGDVFFQDLSISAADMPGDGRFGIKCTAASKGNPNATQAINVTVSQWGQHIHTMDGFILANGYNSFSAINSGALNCNRGFWSTADGGNPPNFFVVSLGCSDHCNTAVALDDGAFAQFSELVVTSSAIDNIHVGHNATGPVSFSNCAIFTTGGNDPPRGAGYRITSVQKPSVNITGGSIRDTAGDAIHIAGNAAVLVTGVAISAIQSGKNADGVRVSGEANVALSGLSLTDIKQTAIHIEPDFTGVLTFSGIAQHTADHGLLDEGSTGTITGSGTFTANRTADIDLSRNKNPKNCIQCANSIPSPADPTPPVPKSGASVTNDTGTHCMIYLSHATISEVLVDTAKLGPQTAFYLPVGRSVEIHYSGSLSWIWQRVV